RAEVLLALPECLVCPPALRDVLADRDDPRDLADRVALNRAAPRMVRCSPLRVRIVLSKFARMLLRAMQSK
ncbi:MAG: hypothetical protein H0U07_10870, partial [Actinobacteria bacterium]|nr:hypothetical protein [Actinomycetota bacterium]